MCGCLMQIHCSPHTLTSLTQTHAAPSANVHNITILYHEHHNDVQTLYVQFINRERHNKKHYIIHFLCERVANKVKQLIYKITRGKKRRREQSENTSI